MYLTNILVVSCFLSVCNSINLVKRNHLKSGNFWHLSDIHVDQNYSRTGNPLKLCHEEEGRLYPDNGLYGNILCDSPQNLVNVTFEAMLKIEPNPDFIIWTGDNLPHTVTFDPDWNVIFEALHNVTMLLEEKFPGIPVYPCIGNHDTFPPNVLLPNQSSISIYKDILNKGGWNKYLDAESSSTFIEGGFYSQVIRPGLRVISLNTILWYTPNNYTEKMKDPLHQLKWFEKVLKKCLRFSEMVYIIGHVPPGFYNRVKPGEKSSPTYHSQYLQSYLKILNQYSKVVRGQMFGHLHIDMFQLFQSDSGSFLSSSILASSITPWHFQSDDNISIPVNPSIRLVHYDYKDGFLRDYDQYFFNLSNANHLNVSRESNEFELLYTFTEAYNVPDVSTSSLVAVYENIKNSDILFEKFFTFSTAGKKSVVCDIYCKVAFLCSISSTSIGGYSACMEKSSNTTSSHNTYFFHKQYSRYLLTFAVAIIILGALYFLLVFSYQRCKQYNNEFYTKF